MSAIDNPFTAEGAKAGMKAAGVKNPAEGVAKLAGEMLARAKLSDVDAKIRYETIMLLECLRLINGAVMSREIINLIRYLLLSGREELYGDNTAENFLEATLRIQGYEMGFERPRPLTVLKIRLFLIPFELRHPEDPSGRNPSLATDSEVRKHMGEKSVKTVRGWRGMPEIKALVAQKRKN